MRWINFVLYGRLPVWQEIFDIDSQGGCSLISGLFVQTRSLLTLMEFAEKALVSKTSFLWTRQKSRFTFSRSDLFRHLSHIYLRNLLAIQLLFVVKQLRDTCRVVLLVLPTMRHQGPDRSRHLIGQRHHHRIKWATR